MITLNITRKTFKLTWIPFDLNTWLFNQESIYRVRRKDDKKPVECGCYCNGGIVYLERYFGKPTKRCYTTTDNIEIEVREV